MAIFQHYVYKGKVKGEGKFMESSRCNKMRKYVDIFFQH